MLRFVLGGVGALALLSACTDDQVRHMAEVGTTKDGRPVYQILTAIRLPASPEQIAERQASTLKTRSARLCPGGYREIDRSPVRKVEQYYDAFPGWDGFYKIDSVWDMDTNTYDTLEQDIRIVCTG